MYCEPNDGPTSSIRSKILWVLMVIDTGGLGLDLISVFFLLVSAEAGLSSLNSSSNLSDRKGRSKRLRAIR
ncbi:hypothetical protein D9M68_890830 [compost metagenome]